MIILGGSVSLTPGIPVKFINFFLQTNEYTKIEVFIDQFLFNFNPGAITCGIGFWFVWLGLLLIKVELPDKRLWIPLICGAVVIIVALALIGSPARPGMEEVTPSPSPPLQLPSAPPQFLSVVVEDGQYSRSKFNREFNRLQATYFKDYSIKDVVDIAVPFYIQKAEVTVGEMRAYQISTGRRVQGKWDKDDSGNSYPDNRPVEGISYQEAEKYAEWLSQKTPGWIFRLPTLEQWAAACLLHGEANPNTKSGQPLTAAPDKSNHLLGNLREWSSSSCRHDKNRRWVLGENYMTERNHAEKEGKCVEIGTAALQGWPGVGFRLAATQD